MQERKKILILDDEPEMLELLQRILSKHYTVHTRASLVDFEKHLHELQKDGHDECRHPHLLEFHASARGRHIEQGETIE